MLKRRSYSFVILAWGLATSRLQWRIGRSKKLSQSYMKNQKWYSKLQVIGVGGCSIAVAACVLFSVVIAWMTSAPLLLLSSVQFLLVSSALMSVVRSVLVIRVIHVICVCIIEETLAVVESRVNQRLLCYLFWWLDVNISDRNSSSWCSLQDKWNLFCFWKIILFFFSF